VFITASSGTGMQEAAVRNFANKSVLSCINGAFGKRWQQVAESNGKQVEVLDCEWDQPISAVAVSKALESKNYEVLLIVHNETSTGLVNPVKEIAAAAFSRCNCSHSRILLAGTISEIF